ncbi:MAG TPA: BTAD domain-containing putative transcriptional regulator [Nonomuraea sp.]|nr:BTAD domain-containing putative transcriptional regulator [Nonomuraea sp.]
MLGPVQVDLDGAPLTLGPRQARAVLALLLLRPGEVVSMEGLIDLLWEGRPPPSARVQLQGLLSGLRRGLGREAIETRAPGYVLDIPPGARDLDRFREQVSAGRRLIGVGRAAAGAATLREALSLWRGEPFAGIGLSAVREAAGRLDELRLAAVEERIAADLTLGRSQELLDELDALVARHPLRENLRGHLMTALARAGRAPEALEVYRQGRHLLVEELGLEPSEALRAVHARILRAEAGWRQPARRDIPHHLPPDSPVLIGRDALAADVARLLGAAPDRTAPPIVAVSGAGGVGKSAFAVHVANLARDGYPDGQLYLRLHGTSPHPMDPGAALARLLHALGIPADDLPRGLDERAELYRDLVSDRQMLVVLDDVADEGQLRPLLPADPGCAVLLTSRRRLAGIEDVRPVPLDVLGEEASLALLRVLLGDRADAEPEAAAELVAYCGGLPLALYVAAARLRHRPRVKLADLAAQLGRDRLDCLEAGDVAVRASIALSYRQLGGAQRRLFRRLGLLATPELTGWSAAALLDTAGEAADRLLDDLVEVHLVEHAGRGMAGPRYRLHDLVHLVARELAVREESQQDRRAALGRVLHGWHDLAAAADAGLPHWYGLDPEPRPRWRAPAPTRQAAASDPMAWFGEEAHLIGAAVQQAADEGFPEVAWPLAQRATTFLDIRGRYDELTGLLLDGLRAAEQAGGGAGTACMLGLLTDVEANKDRFDTALAYGERAFAAYARHAAQAGPDAPSGEEPGRGDERQVAERVRELEEARRRGDPLAVGWRAYRLVMARRAAGLKGGYLALFEEARTGFIACDARLSALWAIKNAGLAYIKQWRFDEAAECLHQARTIIQDGGLDSNAYAAGDIALVYADHGRYGEAEDLTRAELAQARLMGSRWTEGKALDTLSLLAHDRGDHRAALAAGLQALTVWRQVNARSRVAATSANLAGICAAMGDTDAAAIYGTAACDSRPAGGSATSGSIR